MTTTEDKIAIKELEDKIEGMKADKKNKCEAAKRQLVEMLEVTIDKYRTVTGAAEALRVLRFVCGEDSWIDLSYATKLAHKMAEETNRMLDRANELPYAEMDKLCDGFYDRDFTVDGDEVHMTAAFDMAFEMMRIDLCRNVGGAAEDMVSFIERSQEEIDATGEELKKLKAEAK